MRWIIIIILYTTVQYTVKNNVQNHTIFVTVADPSL